MIGLSGGQDMPDDPSRMAWDGPDITALHAGTFSKSVLKESAAGRHEWIPGRLHLTSPDHPGPVPVLLGEPEQRDSSLGSSRPGR